MDEVLELEVEAVAVVNVFGVVVGAQVTWLRWERKAMPATVK